MASNLPSRTRVAIDTFELQMKRRRWLASAALLLLLQQSLVGVTSFQEWMMTDASSQGDVMRQVVMLVAAGILLLAPANARPPMAVPLSILILLGFCLLSTAWAIEPVVSLRRFAYTAIVIWIVVRSVGDLGAVRTLRLVRTVLLILLVLNYAVLVLSPFGKHVATVTEAELVIGDWRGIMQNKNLAGATCAITLLLFLFDRDNLPRWLCNIVVAASLVFLLGSNSKTSIGMAAIAAAAGALMLVYNPRHRSLLLPVGLVAAAGVAVVLAMYSGVIENILSDPGALTGRGAVWPFLLEYAGEHLWTGAGYGSFWQIGSASPIWTLTSGWVASTAAHGHNGYLDILVTIGLPGLLLTVVVLYVWPALRLLYSTGIARGRRALLAALMVFSAGHNMTESTLLDRASAVHVFLIIAIVLVHRLSNQSLGSHHLLRERLVNVVRRGRPGRRGERSGTGTGAPGAPAQALARRRWRLRRPQPQLAAEDPIA